MIAPTSFFFFLWKKAPTSENIQNYNCQNDQLITHSHRLETTRGMSKYDKRSSLPENRTEKYMLFIDKNTISHHPFFGHKSPFSDIHQVLYLCKKKKVI